MKFKRIDYIDEYGTILLSQGDDAVPALETDIVSIKDEEWYVKSRIFEVDNQVMIIELTQEQPRIRSKEIDRLTEVKNVIMGITQRIDEQEKKSRYISGRIDSITTHIRREDFNKK